jgi:hypothetical protein
LEPYLNNLFQDWLKKSEDSTEEISKEKSYKLDLFREILPALERKDYSYYRNLKKEEQDSIEPWLLMRWLTSAENSNDQIHYLISINDIVNHNFSALSSKKTRGLEGHKELQWMLLAMCSNGQQSRKKFIKPPRGSAKNKLESEMLEIFPLMKYSDLELLLKINSKENLKQFFKDRGYPDQVIKDLFKE